MNASVSVVYAHDFRAGQELSSLLLPRIIQNGPVILENMPLLLESENIKFKNSKYGFYWMCIVFLPLESKKKKLKSIS